LKSAPELSSREVLSAIRYLDPDLNYDCEDRKSLARDSFLMRSIRISGLAAALSTIFHLAQRYLRAMIRLLN
jgi:hypothetical protein